MQKACSDRLLTFKKILDNNPPKTRINAENSCLERKKAIFGYFSYPSVRQSFTGMSAEKSAS